MGCFFGAKLKSSAGCVCKRLQKSAVVCQRISDDNLPLTEKVTFKTPLQRGNRVQVPKLVRCQFKMDTEQILKVTVSALNVLEQQPNLLRQNEQRRTHPPPQTPTRTHAEPQRNKPSRPRHRSNPATHVSCAHVFEKGKRSDMFLRKEHRVGEKGRCSARRKIL